MFDVNQLGKVINNTSVLAEEVVFGLLSDLFDEEIELIKEFNAIQKRSIEIDNKIKKIYGKRTALNSYAEYNKMNVTKIDTVYSERLINDTTTISNIRLEHENLAYRGSGHVAPPRTNKPINDISELLRVGSTSNDRNRLNKHESISCEYAVYELLEVRNVPTHITDIVDALERLGYIWNTQSAAQQFIRNLPRVQRTDRYGFYVLRRSN